MTDLTTFAGQTAHYAAVRARLSAGIARVPAPRCIPTARMTVPPTFDFATKPSWRNLLRFVSLKTRIGESAIMSRDRDQVVVHCRSMLMSLLKSHMGMSYEAICTFWGCEPTAVMAAVRRFDRGESSARFARLVAKRAKGPSRPKRERPSVTTKWTAEELEEAQRLRASGMLIKDIAGYYGISDNAMGAVLARLAKRQAGAAP